MTNEQMKDLAKSAAHSAVVSVGMPNVEYAVNAYLEAYVYALDQIMAMQKKAQVESTREFGSNTAKFR